MQGHGATRRQVLVKRCLQTRRIRRPFDPVDGAQSRDNHLTSGKRGNQADPNLPIESQWPQDGFNRMTDLTCEARTQLRRGATMQRQMKQHPEDHRHHQNHRTSASQEHSRAVHQPHTGLAGGSQQQDGPLAFEFFEALEEHLQHRGLAGSGPPAQGAEPALVGELFRVAVDFAGDDDCRIAFARIAAHQHQLLAFEQIGQGASGLGAPISPSGVFVQGLDIAGSLLSGASGSAFLSGDIASAQVHIVGGGHDKTLPIRGDDGMPSEVKGM